MRAIDFGTGSGGAGPYPAREPVVRYIPSVAETELPGAHREIGPEFADFVPVFKREGHDCVVIALPADRLDDWDRANELRFYWISERIEWVAFHFREYVEDVTGTDISVSGPFSIKCTEWLRKIAEAFGRRCCTKRKS